RAVRGGAGAVAPGLEDVQSASRRGGGTAGLTGRGDQVLVAGDLIQAGNRLLQGLRLVGDLELEERRLLNHSGGAFGILDARQLDDDAILAAPLDDGLGNAELVNTVPDD